MRAAFATHLPNVPTNVPYKLIHLRYFIGGRDDTEHLYENRIYVWSDRMEVWNEKNESTTVPEPLRMEIVKYFGPCGVGIWLFKDDEKKTHFTCD